ncbi:MAG: alcohol dehydrogenase catalytic domain-containing protein, partial [Deltaproteobacteria bacterium]|nr:alcohol dehydrogenase catalytic domain-containing protein [Deltaproteobacteria bacterium]
MKKIVIHKPGGYGQLVIEQSPDLEPGPGEVLIDVSAIGRPGEVLIDVSAIGINYADCVTRLGLYASAKHYIGYPITPGFEVAGIVRATGKGVTELQPGTAVLAITRFNGYATQLTVKREQVRPLPAQLSLETAAAFPAVSLTAWYALFELAHPRPGDTLLI